MFVAKQKPYYDDYDENKKFLKTLFIAGRPLQAREATQIQTQLQAQIERFGNHQFKAGARVLMVNYHLTPRSATSRSQPLFVIQRL